MADEFNAGISDEQGTRGEGLSIIIESITYKNSQIFGEMFGNFVAEQMTIFRVVVLEIRARLDFFTIVDPNYIKITRRTNYFAGQFNFCTIFSLDRFQMIYDRRRTWLETWFFSWCCSNKMRKLLFSVVIF